MDSNNPQDQQQNEPTTVAPKPDLPQDTPFVPDSPEQKPSRSKKVLIPLIVAAIILLFLILIGVIAMNPNSFVHRAIFNEKSTFKASKSDDSQATVDKMVTISVSQGENKASVLVPDNWQDSSSSESSISRENFKQYIPAGSDRGENLIGLQIFKGDKNIPDNLSDEALQQAKTEAIAKEESAYRKLLKDCTIERSDYPDLSKEYYGSTYKEKCSLGVTDYDVVQVIIRNLDGTYIEFTLQNSEPNKLNQATVDKIVKSFNFN